MDVQLSDTFSQPVDAVWAVLESEAFEAKLFELSKTRKEQLSATTQGDVITRQTRSISPDPLPKPLAKIAGTSEMIFEQVSLSDNAKHVISWTVTSQLLGDRFESKGTTTLTAEGGGTKRSVKATIRVKIPLVGKKVEKLVAGQIEKTFEFAGQAARALL